MTQQDNIDKKLIQYLDNIYSHMEDEVSLDQSSLKQEKPFTVTNNRIDEEMSNSDISPSQYDGGIIGSK